VQGPVPQLGAGQAGADDAAGALGVVARAGAGEGLVGGGEGVEDGGLVAVGEAGVEEGGGVEVLDGAADALAQVRAFGVDPIRRVGPDAALAAGGPGERGGQRIAERGDEAHAGDGDR
jgi:hypothetical protein